MIPVRYYPGADSKLSHKGWYKAVVDPVPPPAWVNLERITAERVYLYSYVLPPGTNISIYVQPIPVEYSVPTEDKIE